jgi:hypothetical protein
MSGTPAGLELPYRERRAHARFGKHSDEFPAAQRIDRIRICVGTSVHIDADMSHAAHEPTDHRFVEDGLLRHETDAPPIVPPHSPLDESEIQVPEMGHGDDGTATAWQVLRSRHERLQPHACEECAACRDGGRVDGFTAFHSGNDIAGYPHLAGEQGTGGQW